MEQYRELWQVVKDYYFLTKAGVPKATVSGILNENFVYLDLRRRIAHPSEIALETPAFSEFKF